MELLAASFTCHQQDMDVDMIRIAMDRQQGRIILKVGLVQKLPRHRQRYF